MKFNGLQHASSLFIAAALLSTTPLEAEVRRAVRGTFQAVHDAFQPSASVRSPFQDPYARKLQKSIYLSIRDRRIPGPINVILNRVKPVKCVPDCRHLLPVQGEASVSGEGGRAWVTATGVLELKNQNEVVAHLSFANQGRLKSLSSFVILKTVGISRDNRGNYLAKSLNLATRKSRKERKAGCSTQHSVGTTNDFALPPQLKASSAIRTVTVLLDVDREFAEQIGAENVTRELTKSINYSDAVFQRDAGLGFLPTILAAPQNYTSVVQERGDARLREIMQMRAVRDQEIAYHTTGKTEGADVGGKAYQAVLCRDREGTVGYTVSHDSTRNGLAHNDIQTMAHELAHLAGANHDDAFTTEKYLMGDGANVIDAFSEYSKNELRTHLQNNNGCLGTGTASPPSNGGGDSGGGTVGSGSLEVQLRRHSERRVVFQAIARGGDGERLRRAPVEFLCGSTSSGFYDVSVMSRRTNRRGMRRFVLRRRVLQDLREDFGEEAVSCVVRLSDYDVNSSPFTVLESLLL